MRPEVYGHFAGHLGRRIYGGIRAGENSDIPNTRGIRNDTVAAVNFHIFHDHAERLTMTHIAQTVNVLQTMIPTDGPKFALTPTCRVFEMSKVHQGGTVLPADVGASAYQMGDRKVPRVSATATRMGKNGQVHASLVNTHPTEDVTLTRSPGELPAKSVSGRLPTAPGLNSMNTFDAPEAVKPAAFDGASLAGGKLTLTLPAKSLFVLALRWSVARTGRLFPIDPPASPPEASAMHSKRDLLDLQFIETRHLLVELAAFLDRLDRHPGEADFRVDAFRKALPILLEERPDRARAILEALSDHTSEPIPQATIQGAFGAPTEY